MDIKVEGAKMQTYQFGTFGAKHHFGGTCGIHTFVETRLNPGHFRINMGCLEGLDPLALPFEVYPGSEL